MPDQDGKMYSTIWESKKVVLIVDYYFEGDYDYSNIVVMDKNFYGKKKENGF